MVARKNRISGEAFWACSTLKCRGRSSFDAPFEPQESSLQGRKSPAVDAVLFEDRVRASGVVTEAIHRFGSEALATNWLKAPKVGLRGETPLEAIKSVAGCKVVERLLDERFS